MPANLPTMRGRDRGQKWVVDFASVIFLFQLYIILRNISVEIISILSSDSSATFSTILLIILFKCDYRSALLLIIWGCEGEWGWLLLLLLLWYSYPICLFFITIFCLYYFNLLFWFLDYLLCEFMYTLPRGMGQAAGVAAAASVSFLFKWSILCELFILSCSGVSSLLPCHWPWGQGVGGCCCFCWLCIAYSCYLCFAFILSILSPSKF